MSRRVSTCPTRSRPCTRRVGDEPGDLAQGVIDAGSDVDLLGPVEVIEQMQTGRGHIVHMEEFSRGVPLPQFVTLGVPASRASS